MGIKIDEHGNCEFDDEGKLNLRLRKKYGDFLYKMQNDLTASNTLLKGLCRKLDRETKSFRKALWLGEDTSSYQAYVNNINSYLEQIKDIVDKCINKHITIEDKDGTISYQDEDGTIIHISNIEVLDMEDEENET